MRTAVVTGASRGIGAAICRALCDADFRVLMICRSEAAGHSVATSIRDAGKSADVIVADVRDTRAVCAAVLERCSSLEVLVNNAGITGEGLLADVSLGAMAETIQTNYLAPTRLFEALRRELWSSRPGVVINLGSMSGVRPRKGHGSYCMSKAMLIEWTRQQANDPRNQHIRFFCISPGPVDTEMLRNTVWLNDPDALKRIPVGRCATTKEIADWAMLLVKQPRLFANGSNLLVDGGFTKA